MNEADIENAFVRRMESLSYDWPIVWPNKSLAGVAKPYLAVEVVRVSRRIPALATGATISRGFLQVTVVDHANTFATRANRASDSVAAHLPKLLKLPVTGGTITIMDTPEIQSGFREGSDWRVPVRIPYQAIGRKAAP
jgi:hypothetical protein